MRTVRRRIAESKDRAGSSMVAVTIVLLTIAVYLGIVITAGLQRLFMAEKLSNRTKARAFAEAGVSSAWTVLSTNFAACSNSAAFPLTVYGDGAYDVTVKPVGQDVASIVSTGFCGDAYVTVVVDARFRKSGDKKDESPYSYAILSGGDMTWGGNGDVAVAGAPIYCNSRFTLSGGGNVLAGGGISAALGIESSGSGMIYGGTMAPSYMGKSPDNIVGLVTTSSVPPLAMPDLDLAPYFNEAVKNGEVYQGNLSIHTNAPVEPNGGILWVNGNLSISGNCKMRGCFIATGDITISGHTEHIGFEDYPALISRDGDIDITGNGNYHGLIYAKTGGFSRTGGGSVVGTIICAGTFKKGGTWSAMVYDESFPVPPGGVEAKDGVKLRAWHK